VPGDQRARDDDREPEPQPAQPADQHREHDVDGRDEQQRRTAEQQQARGEHGAVAEAGHQPGRHALGEHAAQHERGGDEPRCAVGAPAATARAGPRKAAGRTP
jgi:hypothetical protein